METLSSSSPSKTIPASKTYPRLRLKWNPTTEDQAIDRAHRIGQTCPVTVLQLTVKDTVEDCILTLQQKKRVMVASAFGEDETAAAATQSKKLFLTIDLWQLLEKSRLHFTKRSCDLWEE
ncbi:Helicase-like transcription factor CHR27 [Camellia lanceoleosa]|uniref:Helicase-like transcription factor CHR27 n=1 Tax=Camellia lanceoleosa TaxID=1840588 RepID=A0ACC0IZ23_9ERIC|nr:Helicase-like transcription factor CHR27 [Camellia lanceoleosa]